MSERTYPLPRQDDDPRFTFGLVIDVADALEEHGFPKLQGLDHVYLQQALFDFIYRKGGSMSDDIDKTAECERCRGDIEHYAGIPGNKFMTPFWRHLDLSDPNRTPHAAEPDPATIQEVRQ